MNILNLKPPAWKVARWLGFLLIVGVLLLTLRGSGQPARTALSPLNPGTPAAPALASGTADPVAAEEAALGRSLEAILGQIAGVGRVTVDVALASSDRRSYAIDTTTNRTTTTEKDQGGGARTTAQDSVQDKVVLARDSGGDNPVVVQVSRPEVRGVLVVAEGAASALVRAEIGQAVAAALAVPLYRVVVVPAKGGAQNVSAQG